MQNTNEFYTIEADIFGNHNSFITKIEFHKTKNEAIFYTDNADHAYKLRNRLVALQTITDTVNEEAKQEPSDFKILYESSHLEIRITGNLKSAFELIKEQKINKIISSGWMHDIEKDSKISEIIQKNASSDSEEKFSFSSPRSGFFDNTAEPKDSKGFCGGICNIL